jgi:hypothetical protein
LAGPSPAYHSLTIGNPVDGIASDSTAEKYVPFTSEIVSPPDAQIGSLQRAICVGWPPNVTYGLPSVPMTIAMLALLGLPTTSERLRHGTPEYVRGFAGRRRSRRPARSP